MSLFGNDIQPYKIHDLIASTPDYDFTLAPEDRDGAILGDLIFFALENADWCELQKSPQWQWVETYLKDKNKTRDRSRLDLPSVTVETIMSGVPILDEVFLHHYTKSLETGVTHERKKTFRDRLLACIHKWKSAG